MYALFAGFRYDVDIDHLIDDELIFKDKDIQTMKNLGHFFEIVFVLDLIS